LRLAGEGCLAVRHDRCVDEFTASELMIQEPAVVPVVGDPDLEDAKCTEVEEVHDDCPDETAISSSAGDATVLVVTPLSARRVRNASCRAPNS
jgi:hypothetical protein